MAASQFDMKGSILRGWLQLGLTGWHLSASGPDNQSQHQTDSQALLQVETAFREEMNKCQFLVSQHCCLLMNNTVVWACIIVFDLVRSLIENPRSWAEWFNPKFPSQQQPGPGGVWATLTRQIPLQPALYNNNKPKNNTFKLLPSLRYHGQRL